MMTRKVRVPAEPPIHFRYRNRDSQGKGSSKEPKAVAQAPRIEDLKEMAAMRT